MRGPPHLKQETRVVSQFGGQVQDEGVIRATNTLTPGSLCSRHLELLIVPWPVAP